MDPSGHLCKKKQHTLDKYKANGLGKKEAYVMAQYETILKYEGSDATNRYLGKYGVDIQVGSYKDLRKQKGKSNRQVHHLNQNAALYESLQYAGISKMNAAYATTRAIGQQKKLKLEFMFHEYLEK